MGSIYVNKLYAKTFKSKTCPGKENEGGKIVKHYEKRSRIKLYGERIGYFTGRENWLYQDESFDFRRLNDNEERP